MISQINPKIKSSWNDKIFITIDIDWAVDEIIIDTIKLIENANVSTTWFATHETPVLERIRSNEKFELGIHPNFNFLLNGKNKVAENCEKIIDNILEIVPEAKSIRSHSMTQSTYLLDLFVNKKLKYDCNHFIPEQADIKIKPWTLWNDLIRIPYFWEDDISCIYKKNSPIQELVNRDGLRVFDFHPIHIFLNTENLQRYERTRQIHQNPKELIKYRYNGFGVRNQLIELLKLSKQK
tara:strand:- start:1109 stop:1819 length:711 start_codon:yes stop_codon:yes gene_type:complete